MIARTPASRAVREWLGALIDAETADELLCVLVELITSALSQSPHTERLVLRHQLEVLLSRITPAAEAQESTEPIDDMAARGLAREEELSEYRARTGSTLRTLCERALVDMRDLRRWRTGEMPDRSSMAQKIAGVIRAG